jgi:hypothetical protein
MYLCVCVCGSVGMRCVCVMCVWYVSMCTGMCGIVGMWYVCAVCGGECVCVVSIPL